MIFSFLFWEFNIWMMACGMLYIADMACGMWIAAYKGNWSWPKLRKWVFKFILYGIAIIVWHFLDLLIMQNTVQFGAQYIIIMYLGVTEALSVLKHLANLGLHIPIKLINRLEGIKHNLDSNTNEQVNLSPILSTNNQA